MVNPLFTVNEENVGYIADICRQLEGIPLAIELAAAKLKILSPQKLCQRLNDTFSLLKGGNRNDRPRQQTIKAMIDWSYDLLSVKEQILWRRLSVFSGGWTLEAAEAVCSDEMLWHDEIIELMSLLAEKSIINFSFGDERYTMLDMLKQYGNVILSEAKETELMHLKHYRFFKELSLENKSSGNMVSFLNITGIENANIENALKWSLEQNDAEETFALANALGQYWYIRGLISTGRRWIEAILKKGITDDSPSAGKALNLAGIFTYCMGESETAKHYFEHALSISEKTNDKRLGATISSALGNISFRSGKYADSKKYYEETIEIDTETGNLQGFATNLNNLANYYFYTGQYDMAFEYYDKGFNMSNEKDYEISSIYSLMGIGDIYLVKGDIKMAEETYRKGIESSIKAGSLEGEHHCIIGLGNISLALGKIEEAYDYYLKSLKIAEKLNNIADTAYSLSNLAKVSLAMKEFNRSIEYNRQCIDIYLKINFPREITECLVWLAAINFQLGNDEIAMKVTGKISSWFKVSGSIPHNYEKEVLTKLINDLKLKAGEEIFSNNCNSGENLSLEQAAEIAIRAGEKLKN